MRQGGEGSSQQSCGIKTVTCVCVCVCEYAPFPQVNLSYFKVTMIYIRLDWGPERQWLKGRGGELCMAYFNQ